MIDRCKLRGELCTGRECTDVCRCVVSVRQRHGGTVEHQSSKQQSKIMWQVTT